MALFRRKRERADAPPEPPDPVQVTLAYHERTKHHTHRYARSLGYLDWDSQPDPFRTYEGAPRVELPLVADEVDTTYADLYTRDRVQARALDLSALGAFFELALGLTAWKQAGESRWALRADPSSGNLHPTEGYAISGEMPGLEAGVCHYVSRDHALERRCALGDEQAGELARCLPEGCFVFGISSIHWREAWKYGERAFRYCQHDAGHVIGTARFAAAALGWSAVLLEQLGDDVVARALGLDRDEDCTELDPHDREHPDVLMLVGPPRAVSRGLALTGIELGELLAAGEWRGRPNMLSPEHADWEVIESVAEATHARPTAGCSEEREHAPARADDAGRQLSATRIIRQRRSAVSLDRVTSLPRPAFYAMLARTDPALSPAPWDALAWCPRLHLALFVHRVDELEPGLYLLERNEQVHAALVKMLGPKAEWATPPGCPDDLRLFRIGSNDYRRAAAGVSCGQDIAADGAFSLGMLAEFREQVSADPARYRHLFWESGIIGQVLYLEAEAYGVRGTGIGCYFDDAVHQLVGLEGDQFQSLYHFTLGGPLEDARLQTFPPYEHLGR